MAEGRVFVNGAPVKMERTNTQYWDAAAQQWKAPSQASYYNGSVWIPFIRAVPPPGTGLSGHASGRVPYAGLAPGVSSNFMFDPMTLIDARGFDAHGTAASGGTVRLGLQRSNEADTTRNISFVFQLRDTYHNVVGHSGYVARGEAFSITFPRNRMTNGMYLRWSDRAGSGFNTGWNPGMDGFSLTF